MENQDSLTRIQQFEKVQCQGKNLFIKKNKDYGDAFANYGTIGVLMRIQDKLSRCVEVSKSRIQMVNDECLEDTLIDLHNYAAMALMLYNEKNNN